MNTAKTTLCIASLQQPRGRSCSDLPASSPAPARGASARFCAAQLTASRSRRAGTTRVKAISSESAAQSLSAEKLDEYAPLMDEMTQRLDKDLRYLFSAQGIDESNYDKDVKFLDPITKYNSVTGYAFNIQMLRRLFTPTLNVLSIKRTGPLELTTRWTMAMQLAALAPVRALYYPTITFTGVSILEVNPQTRKFKSHVDKWDSIQNNDYFSFEGVADLIRQMLQFDRTPDLEQPEYTLLTRRANYEVREYEAFLVAETESRGGAASGGGFNDLAGYIFGGNEAGERMEMTAPVFTRVREEGGVAMQFPLEKKYGRDPGMLPAASMGRVDTRVEQGRVVAAAKFTGIATDSDADRVEKALRRDLVRDGLKPKAGFSLARYNDPSTPGPFRRNEVLIELEGFALPN